MFIILLSLFILSMLLFLINRIAIFSVNVMKEERVVVVAEQKPHCSDEEVCLLNI